jgi:hypothetical protein
VCWQRSCRCMQGFVRRIIEKRIIVHIFHFIQAGANFVWRPLRSKLEFTDTFPILFPAMVYAFLSQFRERKMCSMLFSPSPSPEQRQTPVINRLEAWMRKKKKVSKNNLRGSQDETVGLFEVVDIGWDVRRAVKNQRFLPEV